MSETAAGAGEGQASTAGAAPQPSAHEQGKTSGIEQGQTREAGGQGGEPKGGAPATRPIREGHVAPVIRPIPTRRLPGVHTSQDDKDVPDLVAMRRAEKGIPKDGEQPAGQRERNPDGTFKPAAPPAPGAAVKPPDPADPAAAGKPAQPGQAPGATPPPAAGQEFTFAGQKFKDQAAAEQTYRSLQGMFRPLTEERDYGYRAANGWKEAHDRQAARVQELEKQLGVAPSAAGSQNSGAVAAAGQQPSTITVDDVLAGIDTDAFEAVARTGGLPHAGKYLAGEILKAVAEKMLPQYEQRFQAAIAPFQSQHEQVAAAQAAEQVITQVASLKSFDGSREMFPELKDPAALHEIGSTWRSMGLDPEKGMTVQGLMAAVALYRTLRGFVQPETAASLTTPAPVGAPPARQPAAGPAAFVEGEPSSLNPPNRGRSNLSPEAQRFRDALNKTELVDKKLGFARNRATA